MVSQHPPRRPTGAHPASPRPPPRHAAAPGMRPPQRRRPIDPPRSHAVRNTLIAVALLLTGVGAGLAVLSLAFPGDVVRDYIAAEVKARTGRDLIVRRQVTFSAVPSAGVSLNDVTLSSPPGIDAPLMTAKGIDVRVALWPLLWREVVVESVLLNEPVIDLAIAADGRNNWTMRRNAQRERPTPRYAQADTGTASDTTRVSPTLEALQRRNISDVALRDMRIVNGTIRYRDDRSGKSREVTDVTAQLVVKSLLSPASAEGQLSYGGEPMNFTVELGAIDPLLSQASSRLALKLTSQSLNVTYDGTIFPANGEAEGSLEARSPSLAATARLLGTKLPPDASLGALALTGQLRTGGKTHTLSNATLSANGAVAHGHLALDTSHERPLLRGDLALDQLDLDALLNPPRAAEPEAGNAAPPGDATSTPPDPAGTRVNGYTARGGWNEDPVRLAALGIIDADLKLTTASLSHHDLKVGATRLSLALQDRVLKATVDEAALYEGSARGFVVIDGRTPDVAHLGINLTFDNVTLRPFLHDAAKLDWIEGRGTATLAVAGSGAHERAVVESLSGKADVKVGKGAVVGFDIKRISDNLASGRFNDLKPQANDRTAFSGMTASWQIRDGIAHNGDLRLTSDAVVVTGSGTVSLPDRSLDYTVRPKLLGEGEREGRGLAGIEVPVRMSGSWEHPTYKADAGGAVDELGRRLKGKNTDEIVDELVGKDSETGKKAKKLLDKLFR